MTECSGLCCRRPTRSGLSRVVFVLLGMAIIAAAGRSIGSEARLDWVTSSAGLAGPLKPNCIVYNWYMMECSWPPIYTNLSMTFVSLYPSQTCEKESNFVRCQHATSHSCKFLLSDGQHSLQLHKYYCLKLFASNGTLLSATRVTPGDLVKPDPVTELRAIEIKSTSARLAWKSPLMSLDEFDRPYALDRINIRFRVRLEVKTAGRNTEPILLQLDTNLSTQQFYYDLANLLPFTEYSVTVDCKPLVEGKWSNSSSIVFNTSQDVPASLPAVTAGSFSSEEVDVPRRRQVKLFWQPVTEADRRGIITGMRVNYCPLPDDVSQWSSSNQTLCNSTFVGPSVTSITIQLDDVMDTDYAITVEAETEKGFNTALDPRRVYVLAQSRQPKYPEDFVVMRNGSAVIATWTAVSSATRYTVYWCLKSTVDNEICDGPLEWAVVVGSTYSRQFNTRSPSEYRFALSAEVNRTAFGQVVSSGLHWTPSHCLYDVTRAIEKPPYPGISYAKEGRLQVELNERKCRQTTVIQYWKRNDRGMHTLAEIRVAASDDNVVTIGDSVPNAEYTVRLRYESLIGESEYIYCNANVAPKDEDSLFSERNIFISASVLTALIVLLTGAMIWSNRRSIRQRFLIPITIPETCQSSHRHRLLDSGCSSSFSSSNGSTSAGESSPKSDTDISTTFSSDQKRDDTPSYDDHETLLRDRERSAPEVPLSAVSEDVAVDRNVVVVMADNSGTSDDGFCTCRIVRLMPAVEDLIDIDMDEDGEDLIADLDPYVGGQNACTSQQDCAGSGEGLSMDYAVTRLC